MAVCAADSVMVHGVRGDLVRVEADLSTGLPGLSFTGLATASVSEARDRIRAAIVNAGIAWPQRRITLALLPADIPKRGSHLDLALALAVLAAADVVPAAALAGTVWLGELGLDGTLRPVRGVLPAVLAARDAGIRTVVVSEANAAEAALVDGVDVRWAQNLVQVLESMRSPLTPLPVAEVGDPTGTPPTRPDMADVAGQPLARRAVEVAAAGGHHLWLQGVPGAGKTMLAERLPGLLPPLTDAAALELTAIHSVAGRLRPDSSLLRYAPFEAPHHSATEPAVIGGGARSGTPGSISMAHHGVLFLDEAPQFEASTLDALRGPIESGMVVVSRSGSSVTYPARFLLVLASNPCPCGRPAHSCECVPAARRRYADRLSRPLLDRVDIRVWVDPVGRADLFHDPALGPPVESTAVVAARVAQARATAVDRWRELRWSTNAEAVGPVLRRPPWRPSARVLQPAEQYLDSGRMSARGFDRVLRVAWTLADLAGRTSPGRDEVEDALTMRLGRDQVWAA